MPKVTKIEVTDPRGGPIFCPPDSLLINPQTGESDSVSPTITDIRIRGPLRDEFLRIHPDIEIDAELLRLKDEVDDYFISGDLRGKLGEQSTHVTLFFAITTDRVPFIWPIVNRGDATDLRHRSAIEAAHYAMKHWTKILFDHNHNAYFALLGMGVSPEPTWPNGNGETPTEMIQTAIRIAFRDRIIDDWLHPIALELWDEEL